jgi:signal recognition particle receptor subunit beta
VDFANSRTVPGAAADSAVSSVKIVVGGGFGAGKTTFVGSDKTTTTVAMDFGRVTLDAGLILYLFGTPGQHRFWFMWDDLIRGAIGAVVLVDTRRLADSFAAVDYFESARLPFIVAVNGFDGDFPYELADVQNALSVSPHVPVIRCDARQRESTKYALTTLVEHAMKLQLRV